MGAGFKGRHHLREDIFFVGPKTKSLSDKFYFFLFLVKKKQEKQACKLKDALKIDNLPYLPDLPDLPDLPHFPHFPHLHHLPGGCRRPGEHWAHQI